MHKSRNPLYLIPNSNYILCKETNDIYDKNKFECFCEFDGEIFISSYIMNNYKNNIIALINRNSLDDEKCLCLKCKHILYYHSRNQKIKCFKCNIEEIDDNNSIFYNEIFFNKLRDEINFSLVMKRKSNPDKYCSCGGLCYQGKFLEKYILVCSRCQKCQYDIRNGRYKYKLYLFQKKAKNKENENKKDIKINNLKGLKIPSELNNGKKNNFDNHQRKNSEMDSEKNKIPIIPKVIINFNNLSKTKYNRNDKRNYYYNATSDILYEEKKDNKEYSYKNESKNVSNIRRELVIKKAKLLLLNNSMTESRNINNLLLNTNNNKTLVASRKIRVLNGYNLNTNENNSGKIKKIKINELFKKSLDEAYNKYFEDKEEKKYINNTRNIKKNMTNNNSYNNINISINLNTLLNINNKNNYLSTKNFSINKNSNNKKIPNIIKGNFLSNLDMSEYKILSIIHSSSFSTVYKVQNISSRKNYAIKKTIFSSKSSFENWQNKHKELLQIINNIYFLESINIIPIIKYTIKKLDNTSYAVYELMPLADNDLNKKIMYTKKYIPQEKIIKILKQLINALSSMQKNGICHRDIKPGNILEINDNYYIGDFDQSIKVRLNSYDIETEIKGTEAFLSPLMFNALIRNKKKVRHNIFKSDVYSLGLCFIFVLTKNVFVLQKIKDIKQNEKIKMFILDNLYDKKMKLNLGLLEFIVKMVTWDEKNRPDFIELNDLINEKNYNFF